MLDRIFLSHPRTVGETYWQHLGVATRFGMAMLGAGCAALIHALVPALFERTASNAVKRLYGEMKRRQPAFSDEPPAFTAPAWQIEYEI